VGFEPTTPGLKVGTQSCSPGFLVPHGVVLYLARAIGRVIMLSGVDPCCAVRQQFRQQFWGSAQLYHPVGHHHLTDDRRSAMAAMWKEENKKPGPGHGRTEKAAQRSAGFSDSSPTRQEATSLNVLRKAFDGPPPRQACRWTWISSPGRLWPASGHTTDGRNSCSLIEVALVPDHQAAAARTPRWRG